MRQLKGSRGIYPTELGYRETSRRVATPEPRLSTQHCDAQSSSLRSPRLKSQPLKILFVCSRNKKRSRTAEEIFKGHSKIQALSAGTEPSSRIKITEGLIGWADLILVMERKHSTILFEKFPEAIASKKIHCLGIPDEFEFMDEDLITILKAAAKGFTQS